VVALFFLVLALMLLPPHLLLFKDALVCRDIGGLVLTHLFRSEAATVAARL
jgi:hypothetical protein